MNDNEMYNCTLDKLAGVATSRGEYRKKYELEQGINHSLKQTIDDLRTDIKHLKADMAVEIKLKAELYTKDAERSKVMETLNTLLAGKRTQISFLQETLDGITPTITKEKLAAAWDKQVSGISCCKAEVSVSFVGLCEELGL
ncbi:hypothetical protein KAR91_40900 [Candidatus Pacearchaeota archaeon]|nr:hypothetical protein [Candidatus Pacearchaeota archaeon]